MREYQALATPAALNSPDYDQNAAQAHARLSAVAEDGQHWAAQQARARH